MSVSYDFEGKVALITGSSSGIGAATALLFVKSGAQVVINGVNELDVQSVAKQCSDVSPNGSKALAVVADITIEEEVKRLVQSTIDTFGKLDILVNNAAISLSSTINDQDYFEVFHKVMSVGLNAVVLLTHKCVEHLEKTNGNIINVSSVRSLQTAHGYSAYCTAKAAVDMFTRCMATELGPKRIRVNSVNPGVIETNIIVQSEVNYINGFYENTAQVLPVGRVGNVEDIANAILFLATEQASFIDGSHLIVDGGHVAANISLHR